MPLKRSDFFYAVRTDIKQLLDLIEVRFKAIERPLTSRGVCPSRIVEPCAPDSAAAVVGRASADEFGPFEGVGTASHGVFISESPIMSVYGHATGVEKLGWPSKVFKVPIVRACLEQPHLSAGKLQQVTAQGAAAGASSDYDNALGTFPGHAHPLVSLRR